MRNKEEIQREIIACENALQRQEKLVGISNQLIVEYKAKIDELLWVLAEEVPIKTEGTR